MVRLDVVVSSERILVAGLFVIFKVSNESVTQFALEAVVGLETCFNLLTLVEVSLINSCILYEFCLLDVECVDSVSEFKDSCCVSQCFD